MANSGNFRRLLRADDTTAPSWGVVGWYNNSGLLIPRLHTHSYAWNVGVEAQSLEVSNSGEFQLDFTDVCGNTATSDLIEVNVYGYPEAPTTEDFTIALEII